MATPDRFEIEAAALSEGPPDQSWRKKRTIGASIALGLFVGVAGYFALPSAAHSTIFAGRFVPAVTLLPVRTKPAATVVKAGKRRAMKQASKAKRAGKPKTAGFGPTQNATPAETPLGRGQEQAEDGPMVPSGNASALAVPKAPPIEVPWGPGMTTKVEMPPDSPYRIRDPEGPPLEVPRGGGKVLQIQFGPRERPEEGWPTMPSDLPEPSAPTHREGPPADVPSELLALAGSMPSPEAPTFTEPEGPTAKVPLGPGMKPKEASTPTEPEAPPAETPSGPGTKPKEASTSADPEAPPAETPSGPETKPKEDRPTTPSPEASAPTDPEGPPAEAPSGKGFGRKEARPTKPAREAEIPSGPGMKLKEDRPTMPPPEESTPTDPEGAPAEIPLGPGMEPKEDRPMIPLQKVVTVSEAEEAAEYTDATDEQPFLQQVATEANKVEWPSPGEVFKLTTIVVVSLVGTSIFILGVDRLFGAVAEALFENRGGGGGGGGAF